MKLHQLRAVVAICESGSIQEASRILHVSQPALSKSIKELESELGVPLLVRSNRGITATPYGEHLVRRARLVVEEVRRARDEIETLKGTMDGRVTIGVSPVTPSQQFVSCILSYRKRYPKVELQILELRPAKLMEGLREGLLDLALTSHPPLRSVEGFEWHELYAQPTTLAVRKGHPRSKARSLSELLDLEWLLPDALDSGMAGRMFEEYGVKPPERTIVCASVVLYAELAATTDAVSSWSRRVFDLPIVSGNLDMLSIAERVPGTDISLVCRPVELMTRETQKFVDDIIYAFKNPQPLRSPLHNHP
ncbi:LysR substrate-binding domain-containing protein [Pseudomonas sp. NPDC089401]|uniref:LysR substrate-binding domain-containing protein n=1 Tax=Pseudomonas sp. NPDC089401 TaxID=3364462 RepID=UPI0038229CC5